MIYLDTSVVVAAVALESTSGYVQRLIVEQAAGSLAISEWTIMETSSALAIKLRTGQLTSDERSAALAGFRRLQLESFTTLELRSGHFRTAAAWIDRSTSALKSGDALHLSIAVDYGATLWTLDRRLAETGLALGASAKLLA